MKIDLTPILNGEVKELPFTFTENVPAQILESRFKGLDMAPDGDVTVNGKLTDISGYYEISLDASLRCATHCARCGKEMNTVCACSLRLIASKDAERAEDEDISFIPTVRSSLTDPCTRSFPSASRRSRSARKTAGDCVPCAARI